MFRKRLILLMKCFEVKSLGWPVEFSIKLIASVSSGGPPKENCGKAGVRKNLETNNLFNGLLTRYAVFRMQKRALSLLEAFLHGLHYLGGKLQRVRHQANDFIA